MKHAINELKMVLDIAKNNEPIQRAAGEVEQADLNVERIRDVEDALHLLQIWNDTKSPKSYSSDKFRADMAETNAEEVKEKQLHRRFEYTFEEAQRVVGGFAHEMKVDPLPEDFKPEDNYAPATCFYEDNPTLKCQVEREDESIDREPREKKIFADDDLGELDASKACGFGEEGCSSCQ